MAVVFIANALLGAALTIITVWHYSPSLAFMMAPFSGSALALIGAVALYMREQSHRRAQPLESVSFSISTEHRTADPH